MEKLTIGGRWKKMKRIWRERRRKRKTLNAIKTLKPLAANKDASSRYVVSLTSYGKRLTDTAPYAIVTLFDQSVQPDKIVLWVANEDRENVPHIMEELVKKGLEIRFCEDIKSYKKLIPAIESFPEDYIITADDDLYYPHNWFEQLLTEHKKNPKKIICHRAHGIKVDENHNPLPYKKWDFYIQPSAYFAHIFVSQELSVPCHQLESLFPTGCGGVLYPPHCLRKEVTNKDLFMKLAPKADDIWFWAMAVTHRDFFGEDCPYVVVENGYSEHVKYIDMEQTEDVNALWNYNFNVGNNVQLKAVIERYPQIMEVFGKIESSRSTNGETPKTRSGKVFDSGKYWEERYMTGGNSGAGSYNHLAKFKAEILNDFVEKHLVQSVIEFGCGDGNQLFLAKYPKYVGFDVSDTAISICKSKFSNDTTKDFRLMSAYNGEKAELTLSLDVVYHLTEDAIFNNYMKTLFAASTKIVIVYASNKTSKQWARHVKHRKFTDWVETNEKNWKLLQFIPNRYPATDNKDNPNTSFADFYIFGNKSVFEKLMSAQNPIISILVPIYNTQKYLSRCLDSILNQTIRNIEVICVNDASPDNSLRILNKYARKDSRIIVIDKRQNEGLPQARRSAIVRSNGQYILPIDSDDWIEENICEYLYYAAVFGGYDIVCCGYFEERRYRRHIFNAQILPEEKSQKIKHGIFGFGNAKVVWNKLVKKDVFERIMFPIENNGEDCYISCQNFYYADKIGYYPKPLYHWRYSDKSLTANKSLAQKRYEDRKANYEHIIEFCKEKFGNDLSIFEPELSARMKWLEEEQKP